jgi:hypothetical protein
LTLARPAPAREALEQRLVDILSEAGRQVKVDHWHDPRLIIVHDVEQPIPLYYFPAITGDIEQAYIRVAANEQRGYNLHTDFRWERSLPNLNPRRSELGVSWALETLAAALVNGVITPQGGTWTWVSADNSEPMLLHPLLSGALYKLGELHSREKLRSSLETQIERAAEGFGEQQVEQRRAKVDDWLEQQLIGIEKGEITGKASKEAFLDRPVIRALQRLVRAAAPVATEAPSAPGGYQPLDFDS